MDRTLIVQLLLIAGLSTVVLSFLRNRNTARIQAGKKLLFGLFVIACIASVANPEMLTSVANAVGVGRGADLVLYGLVVAFAFVSLNTYLKFKDMEARVTVLARQLAISQAVPPNQMRNAD
jgi:hypothetical protein